MPASVAGSSEPVVRPSAASDMPGASSRISSGASEPPSSAGTMPSCAPAAHSPFARASWSPGVVPPRCSLGLTGPCCRSSPAIDPPGVRTFRTEHGYPLFAWRSGCRGAVRAAPVFRRSVRHHAAPMSAIADATAATFDAEALSARSPVVLVDFWAPWCAPCRALTPALEQLAAERDDLKLVRVNTDEEQALAARYGVTGLPTVMILRDGEPVGTITQAAPKRRLAAQIDAVLAA